MNRHKAQQAVRYIIKNKKSGVLEFREVYVEFGPLFLQFRFFISKQLICGVLNLEPADPSL